MNVTGRPHNTNAGHMLIIISILLLGGWLRLHEATRDVRFHSDEALYSTYARNAAVYGYWMLNGPLDKPPLSIYTSALAMHFFAADVNDLGVIDVLIKKGEFAAKIPNIFAGLISIALSYAIAHELYRQRGVALMTALVIAISPYAVAYSASAFTDALMLVFMLAAWLLAIRHRPIGSGLMLALSFSAKPQGLLYLPLIILFLLIDLRKFQNNRFYVKRDSIQRIVIFTLSLLVGIGFLLLWDSLRPETSLFTLGSINISQGRFITPPQEWIPRLQEWLRIGDNLLGWGWFTAVLILASIFGVIRRKSWLDWCIMAMIIGFFTLHWIAAFWTFDRYLLPLVPLFALLIACMYQELAHSQSRSRLLTVIFAICLLVYGATARHDPRADAFHGETQSALIDLGNYLNAKPLGTIIYDRWMGWELGYYIGAWSDKRRVYYPEPTQQASEALLNPDRAPRYLVAPANRDSEAWLMSFARVGFTVCVDYSRDGFAVYHLTPPLEVALADYLPGNPQVWDDAIVESSWRDPVWCDGESAS